MKFERFATFQDDIHFQTDNSLLNLFILNTTNNAFRRPARVLVTGGFTNLRPSHLLHDQTFHHLTHFVIVVHIIIFLESVQKIVNASTIGSTDQEHQSVSTTTLTKQGLQTLSIRELVLEMTIQPFLQRGSRAVRLQR